MMRIYFLTNCLLVTLLFSTSLLSQALSNELGYNLEHYQRQTALTVDESGSYYAISYTSSGFATYAALYRADENGAVIWSEPFNAIWAEVTDIQDIVVDGEFLMVSGYLRECCDCTSAYAFLARYDLDGQLIWIHSHEGPVNEWFTDILPLNLHKAPSGLWTYELKSYEGSALARIDTDGNLVDSIPLAQYSESTDLLSFDDGSIAFLKEDSLYHLDVQGELLSSIELTYNGLAILAHGDSLLVLHNNGIEILDSDLLSLGSIAPWNGGLAAYGFKATSDGIRVHLTSSDGFTLMDLNSDLSLIEEVDMEIEMGGGILLDSHESAAVLLEGYPLTELSAVRYRAYDMESTVDAPNTRTEVEPIGIVANDMEVTSYISGNYNIVTVSFDHSILIKNNGPNELTSCRFNRFLGQGICALAYYSQEFTDLSIASGDSAWVDLGYTGFYQNAYPIGDTITYTACFFSSNPNGLVDLEVSNDEICDTYEIYPTAIPEEERAEFSLYPNPATELLQIQGIVNGQSYTILDLEGRVIQASHIAQQRIDVSALAPGNYLLRIKSDHGTEGVQRFSIVH